MRSLIALLMCCSLSFAADHSGRLADISELRGFIPERGGGPSLSAPHDTAPVTDDEPAFETPIVPATGTEPGSAAAPTAAPPASLPVVTCYVPSGGWCSICNWWKRRDNTDLPFDLQFVVNDAIGNYPVFYVDRGPAESPWYIWNVGQDATGLVREWHRLTSETAIDTGESPDAAPTPHSEIDRILSLAPAPRKAFVDFGCGDGRWLIAATEKWGCRSIGVEIDPERAEEARERIREAGLEDRIEIITGDATQVDVDADVGVAFLWPETLAALKPQIQKLDWFASVNHRVPGLSLSQNGDAYIWKRPQPVAMRPAGVWYGGQWYSGPVCNSRSCAMCNAIRQMMGR